jgi:hypothetical protein
VLWDERQALGRWLAAHPDLRSKGLIGRDVMWDTYLLFGREAVWGESPSHLVSAGHTVVGSGPRLQADIVPLLRPAAR